MWQSYRPGISENINRDVNAVYFIASAEGLLNSNNIKYQMTVLKNNEDTF
jgi:hypothetical protein